MTNHTISLTVAHPDDLADFKRELQEAFSVAVIDEYGDLPDGPIPSDEELDQSINASGAVALRILSDGKKIGGTVVTINEETHHNTLDLFFLKVRRAWPRSGAQGVACNRSALSQDDHLANTYAIFREEEHPLLRQQVRLQDHRVSPRQIP